MDKATTSPEVFQMHYEKLEPFLENRDLFVMREGKSIKSATLYKMFIKAYNIHPHSISQNRLFPKLMLSFTERHYATHNHYVDIIRKRDGMYYEGIGCLAEKKRKRKYVRQGPAQRIERRTIVSPEVEDPFCFDKMIPSTLKVTCVTTKTKAATKGYTIMERTHITTWEVEGECAEEFTQ